MPCPGGRATNRATLNNNSIYRINLPTTHMSKPAPPEPPAPFVGKQQTSRSTIRRRPPSPKAGYPFALADLLVPLVCAVVRHAVEGVEVALPRCVGLPEHTPRAVVEVVLVELHPRNRLHVSSGRCTIVQQSRVANG